MRTLKFVYKAPGLILLLFAINLAVGQHWWAAKPAGILAVLWVLAVFRVIRAGLLVGGLAGLAALMSRR